MASKKPAGGLRGNPDLANCGGICCPVSGLSHSAATSFSIVNAMRAFKSFVSSMGHVTTARLIFQIDRLDAKSGESIGGLIKETLWTIVSVVIPLLIGLGVASAES